MQAAPPRHDEAASLAALHALEVLDSGPEAEFDALVRAASIVCGTSVSLLSLIDAERQWFKANIGLPGVSETPRDLAFCAHAVLGDELFEVADASLDARFADNPLVAGQPGIRFYAGAPVRLSDGSRIGTLCVIDRLPQRLSDDQRQVLLALATAAAHALEGRRAMRAVKQISRDMADSEARFRALSDSAPVGVFELDAMGNFSYGNQRLLDIVGLQRGQVLSWARVVHADDRKDLSLRWSNALARQQDLDAQFRVLRPDGRIRHVWAHARMRLGEDGLPGGYVGTVEDITELRHQQDELREAKRVAEAANKAKSEFLANMSHEIRTPMHAILGLLTLLRRTPLSERQADYAGKTEGAARALLGLLNEILDFSKVEAGKMMLDPQPMRLDDLLRDLAVILTANIGARNLQLLFDIDPALPSEWLADAMRLRQVLVNLAGNAIKFTEQGEVTLAMSLLQQDGDLLRVRFAVRDTGIGIAPENQARIFAGFTQAEASTTRRFGGTGLGLAISQRLVALMGGELSLQSELGRGSCFEFSLSLKRSGAAVASEQVVPPAFLGQQRLAGLRLLLVEDNLNNQQVACELLSEEGALVQIAADGRQAINALTGSAGAFDIVLMDLQMPVMDGYAATRHLREVLGLRDLPIIAMTANAMSSDRVACLAAGMNDHVGKPFDLDDLVRVLRQHAGRPAAVSAAPAGHPPAGPAHALTQAAAAAAAAGVGLDAAIQRMGGKPVVYSRMLDNFVQELAALREQLARGDVATCRRLLHTLKGVAATLGAEQLAAQAGRQERALVDGGALSDCVAAADAALAVALPGLTELALLLRMSDAAGEGLLSIAQLPAAERLDFGAALAELLRLLRDSDMAALAQMSVLRTRYAQALGGARGPLDEALTRLDFAAAIAQCSALLEQLAAEPA